MAKKIEVLSLKTNGSIQDWSRDMDALPRHPIDIVNWSEFAGGPATSFSIAHSEDAILLKFFVNETDPKVSYYSSNDPVYKDSCVEFFISWDQGATYYNLECNAVGTFLMAHGPSRHNRIYLPPELIATIGHYSYLPSPANEGPATGWTLTLQLPLGVFIHDAPGPLAGRQDSANFYKCGDECVVPHYLSWNKIGTPTPDFHQPRYFGELLFL